MHQSSVAHTVVTMGSPAVEQHPRDHLVWSIFNVAYMNPCCLALVALYYSVRARDMKLVGNLQLARNHGSRARCFNIAAVVIGVVIILIVIIIVGVSYRSNSYNPYNPNKAYYRPNRYN